MFEHIALQDIPSLEEMQSQCEELFEFVMSISIDYTQMELEGQYTGSEGDVIIPVRRFSGDEFKSRYGTFANGATHQTDDGYFIFICEAPYIVFDDRFVFLERDYSSDWLDRYLVYHECGHIIEKHVLNDDPENNYDYYRRRMIYYRDNKELEYRDLIREREILADKWAAHFLMEHAESEGEHELVKRIKEELEIKGIPTV